MGFRAVDALVLFYTPREWVLGVYAAHLAVIFERSSIGNARNSSTIPARFLNQIVQN